MKFQRAVTIDSGEDNVVLVVREYIDPEDPEGFAGHFEIEGDFRDGNIILTREDVDAIAKAMDLLVPVATEVP